MSTATAELTQQDPNIADAEKFERDALDKEGYFLFRLTGVFGRGETNNGKQYISVQFTLDQQAEYDEQGNLTEITTLDPDRPRRILHKFWIESSGGNKHLASWFDAVGVKPTGTLNPATGRYEFLKDEVLSSTQEQSAWNNIRHEEDPIYGWQSNVGFSFRRKAPNRIKVSAPASDE